jgi:hypothetical protein
MNKNSKNSEQSSQIVQMSFENDLPPAPDVGDDDDHEGFSRHVIPHSLNQKSFVQQHVPQSTTKCPTNTTTSIGILSSAEPETQPRHSPPKMSRPKMSPPKLPQRQQQQQQQYQHQPYNYTIKIKWD